MPSRVSVQGVKSFGSHFACLCRGFEFYEVKIVIIFIAKSLQKEKIAQICYYNPKSAGINLQSPQSASTPNNTIIEIAHYLT